MFLDMSSTIELEVETSGLRVDQYLSGRGIIASRSYAQKLIREGHILINERTAKASFRLSKGDRIRLPVPSAIEEGPIEEAIPLKVVFEDENMIVIDKPAGMVAHPAAGHATGTLVNALLSHCPDLADTGNPLRPGIVHRLDKDTSGLMMVAKNQEAYLYLRKQFEEGKVAKTYLALIEGNVDPEHGAIEASIGRDPRNRKRMAVVKDGRAAMTEYRVVQHFRGYTLVEAMPRTGRTHQIRVHFAAIGHPVVGDGVYGRRSSLLGRQFLHSTRLGLQLPGTREYAEFNSDLPDDLKGVLVQLTLEGGPGSWLPASP